MMVSLGIGTSVLSRAINPAISQYPPSCKTDRYQSEKWCSSSATTSLRGNSDRLLVERLDVDRHLGIGPGGGGVTLAFGGRGARGEFALELALGLLGVRARILAHRADRKDGRIAARLPEARVNRLAGRLRRLEGVAANIDRHPGIRAPDELGR